jgi:hypothetical protein
VSVHVPADDVYGPLSLAELVTLRAGISLSIQVLDEILEANPRPSVRAAARLARERAERNLARVALILAERSEREGER